MLTGNAAKLAIVPVADPPRRICRARRVGQNGRSTKSWPSLCLTLVCVGSYLHHETEVKVRCCRSAAPRSSSRSRATLRRTHEILSNEAEMPLRASVRYCCWGCVDAASSDILTTRTASCYKVCFLSLLIRAVLRNLATASTQCERCCDCCFI